MTAAGCGGAGASSREPVGWRPPPPSPPSWSRPWAAAPPSTETDFATEPSAPKASANGNGDQSGLPSPGPDDVEWSYPDRPDGWWNMPATTMAAELAELLPEGMELTDAETTNTDRAPGEAKRELEGYLTAVLRPAEGGPGKVNMIFSPPNSGEPVPPVETLPDGNMRMFGQDATPAEMTSCDPDWIANPEDCTEILDDGRQPASVASWTAPAMGCDP